MRRRFRDPAHPTSTNNRSCSIASPEYFQFHAGFRSTRDFALGTSGPTRPPSAATRDCPGSEYDELEVRELWREVAAIAAVPSTSLGCLASRSTADSRPLTLWPRWRHYLHPHGNRSARSPLRRALVERTDLKEYVQPSYELEKTCCQIPVTRTPRMPRNSNA